MTKYLFLLGFFVFSFSFLSGCKMSDFYSAPVANADSAPAVDTDSAPVADADSDLVANADSALVANADSAPVADADSVPVANAGSASVTNANSAPVADANQKVAYTGIVYQNDDRAAVSCSKIGMEELKEIRETGEDYIPSGCKRGGFSNFILFEEQARTSQYVYVRAFISSYLSDEWKEAYLRVKKGTKLVSCREASSDHGSPTRDCENNLGLYEEYKVAKTDSDPVAGADSDLVANADSAPAANATSRVAYTGHSVSE